MFTLEGGGATIASRCIRKQGPSMPVDCIWSRTKITRLYLSLQFRFEMAFVYTPVLDKNATRQMLD